VTGGVAQRADLVKKLGKVTTGKGCIYVKRVEDIDLAVLAEMVKASIAETKQRVKDRKKA
jgi:hypothetical protein